MRRQLLSSYLALAFSFGISPLARAQEPEKPAEPAPDPATTTAADPSESDEAEPSPADAPEQPRVLEPPNLGPLGVDPEKDGAPDPAASADRLAQSAPPPPVEKKKWTLPETVFHLHGYMRFRGNYLKDGALGHRPGFDRLRTGGTMTMPVTRQNYDPFPYFTPDDSTVRSMGQSSGPIEGGCGDDSNGGEGRCSKKSQVSGDLRFRVKPEIHLSDDVRVKAWIDVLDNVGLGTMGYGPGVQPEDAEARTAIRARRVWGEARNRDIGELRFGRMGADWGLGILDNGGDRLGIDSDFSSEVDRLMGITNLGGFYLMAAYDWASEGKVLGKASTPSGVPIDSAQRDDLDAFTFSVAHKLDEDVQQSTLARGDAVFNYGVYFIYRKQLLRALDGASLDADLRYTRVNKKEFVPDLWAQFLWEGLRIELEAVALAGNIEGVCPSMTVTGTGATAYRTATEQPTTKEDRAAGGTCKLRQFGAALEMEYRLFDERLGLQLNAGYASGDSQAYGLAATNDPSYQRSAAGAAASNRTISTYSFHPDYRIDLILWRTIMRRVAGAYYFKPSVSYDFIRDPYGQLAGARLDLIYSRATNPNQTWGKDGNLGLELDVSLYYRSEDGPDVLDGFYGLVQWGVLFPLAGLDYDGDTSDAPGKKNAMVLRGVAGIAF